MKTENHVGQLTQLGLNAYEAKAYAALLGKESFTASQVADLSGVPRQRIYDILASLVERGLAISRPNRRGTKYAAVAPDRALSGLLDHQQQRLDHLQSVTRDLIDVLTDQYQSSKESGGPLEYIEVLRGTTAINQRFAEIQDNCQREILVLTRPPYAKPPQDNVEGIETVKRQIRACSIYEESVLIDPETRRGVASFLQHGEEARFVKHLPLKLVIVDETIVMFAMEDPIVGRTDMTIMVIENIPLAKLLKLAFEALWNSGDSFMAACERMNLPYDLTMLARQAGQFPLDEM
jgi:HTH-type transcriptional regulator, sugar sensing transcriptional regulator